MYMATLLLLGSSGTGDNLDQFAGNDSLSGTVEQNGEFADHVTGVLGCVVHGVTTSGLLAGVTLSECPVKRVGEGVLPEMAKD